MQWSYGAVSHGYKPGQAIPCLAMELTAEVIHRDSGEQDAREFYLIAEPPFEHFDAAVIWDEFARLFNHDQETDWLHDGYRINEHKRIVEWGASGFLQELVVEAGEHVPDIVIAYGLNEVLNRLVDRLGIRDVPPLDRERALNSARWTVLRATPSLTSEELGEPTSEEHDAENRRWHFAFRPGNGFEYAAEVGWHSKAPGVVRSSRRRIDPNAHRVQVVSGSIVERRDVGGEWVVIDVTGDGLAVLRKPEDVDAGEMDVVPVIELKLVGHLQHLDGWIEESHGVWRKLD